MDQRGGERDDHLRDAAASHRRHPRLGQAARCGAPGADVVVAEDEAHATPGRADGAYGTPTPACSKGARLRWLQAPEAAPPAGYYYAELIAHPAVVTNLREIYNDHIGAHIMAFVLAFARGLHHYLPLQPRREWQPAPSDTGVIHLPEATALIVGVGGIGSEAARLAEAFGMRVIGDRRAAAGGAPRRLQAGRAGRARQLLPEADFVILTVPHTPETQGFITARDSSA